LPDVCPILLDCKAGLLFATFGLLNAKGVCHDQLSE